MAKLRPTILLAFVLCGAASFAEEAPKTQLFDVALTDTGDNKIQAIKLVRDANPGLGLAEAYALVKAVPVVVKKGVSKDEGEKIIRTFEANHSKAELRDAAGKVVERSAEAPVTTGNFEVVLKSFKQKIMTIKVVREITGLGLAEAKKMVESAPVTVKAGLPKDDAEKFKKQLEAVEAEAELKESAK